ncbi:3-isopropylmalate dehydratase small subunit [Streptomyces viridochromogenes]|uniref:3-isopropylmalate dehydratase small subunit n=1 Tax=Streptomyces viridochromogenes Tue57 TaxID=1160705 RepID=L8PDB1_STRVR|nr:3-isopropylmalate dehydratase small subunit [Streptomyces viridochromogenes]ELS53307.1 putative Isopropylmalate isomerase small subunit [Streptomyces viridochromogenes Tue57]
MEPFILHVGRAVALRRDNVDTDQIVPGEFCKRVTKTGYDDALFARWRKEPGFVLDRPEHRGASILLAGRDFGIGSSREHAVWALRDGGFAVVVASGFGDIFRRNATNNGLLLVDLPAPEVQSLMELAEKDPDLAVAVDLRQCRITAAGRDWPFAIEPRARRRLLAGEDPIAATLRHADRITAYERARADWLPALGGHPRVRE